MVNVRSALDVSGIAHEAASVARAALREIWVTPSSNIRSPGSGRNLLGVVTLVVVGLGLEERDHDVLRALQVELVQPPMLTAQSVEPGSLGSFDEHTALTGNVRSSTAVVLAEVIGNPVPHVLEVSGRSRGEVNTDESTLALVASACARADQSISTTGTTNSDERVPDGDISRGVTGHVELKDDSTGEHVGNGESHILDVSNTLIASLANGDNGLGVLGVLEVVTVTGNSGPGFSDDLRSNGNKKSRVDTVLSEGEVGNLLLAGNVLEDRVKSSRLVNGIVTENLSTTVLSRVLDVDEVGDSVGGIVGSRDRGERATRSEGSRSSGGGGSGAVDGVSSNSVTVGVGSNVRLAAEESASAVLGNIGGGVLGEVVDEDGGVDSGLKGHARVDRLGVNNTNVRGSSSVQNTSSDSVESRSDDLDGVATSDKHTNSILVEVDALVLSLLVTVVPDTVLTLLNADVRETESRTATKMDTGVTVAARGSSHGDFDVLELSGLGNTPFETVEVAGGRNS